MARFASHKLQSALQHRSSVTEGIIAISPISVVHNDYIKQFRHFRHLFPKVKIPATQVEKEYEKLIIPVQQLSTS